MSADAAKAAFDMLGSIATGVANSKAAGAKRMVNQMNRDISLRQTALDVYRQRQKNRYNAGKNRARAAASGLSYDGSAVDIMNNNALQDELDVMLTEYQGKKTAWGYETGAAFNEAEGNNALIAGFLNAGSKLAQGYSNSYTNGNNMPGQQNSLGSGWYSTQAESSAAARRNGITWDR